MVDIQIQLRREQQLISITNNFLLSAQKLNVFTNELICSKASPHDYLKHNVI